MTSLTRLQPSHRRSRLAVAGCMWHVGLRMRRERARRRQTGGGPKVKTPVFERALARGIHPPSSLPPPTTNTNGVKGEGKKERRRGGGFCFATPHSLETFLVLFYVLFGLGPPRAKKKRRGEKRTAGRRSEGRAGGRGRDLATPPESRCMRRGLREFPTR